ncbi:hypothetical protein ACFLY4_10200 [Chloroflexota bacterium]
MTNDGPTNPTSPPTPDEETTSSSGDPPFWLAELPHRVLSGGLSLSKAEVEGRVPLPREPVRGEGPHKNPPNQMDEETPLQDEIDSMRHALKRLVESFSKVEALEDQFKLSSAINYTTASLTRLVRAQQILRDHQPNTFDQSLERAINVVLKEWGRL